MKKIYFVFLTVILLHLTVYSSGCAIKIGPSVEAEKVNRVFGNPWKTVTTPGSELLAQGNEFCYKLIIKPPPDKEPGYTFNIKAFKTNLLNIVPPNSLPGCRYKNVTLRVRDSNKEEMRACKAYLPTVSDDSGETTPKWLGCDFSSFTVNEGDGYFFCIEYPITPCIAEFGSIVHHKGGDGIESTYGEVFDSSTETWGSVGENEEYIRLIDPGLFDTNGNLQSHDAIFENGDFELGTTGWFKSSLIAYGDLCNGEVSLSSNIIHSGSYSLKLSRDSSHAAEGIDHVGIDQIMEIDNNKKYYLDAWIYVGTNMDDGLLGGFVITSETGDAINIGAYGTPDQIEIYEGKPEYFTIGKLEEYGIQLFEGEGAIYIKDQWLHIKDLPINTLFNIANTAAQAEGKTIEMKDTLKIGPRLYSKKESTTLEKHFTMYFDDITITSS